MSWYSSIDGDLGSGELLHPVLLSVGKHQLTLTAVDSAGNQAQASVSITILGDASEMAPQFPTLEIGPLQALFVIGSQVTPPYTQTISLHELTGGAVTWTASSSVPWLTLNKAGGETPADLLLTVNPAGLAIGAYTGDLTIQAPDVPSAAAPLRTWTIPVILNITSQPATSGWKVFLPLVQR